MKFANPNGKRIGDLGVMVAGIIVGSMASDGVVSLIHNPKAGADAATAKKEETMLLVKRGAIIAASGYGAAGITGTDSTSVFVKNVGIGMAVKQSLNVVKDIASKNSKLADTSTKPKKFIANALGLACACDVPAMQYGMGRAKRRALRSPYEGQPNMENFESANIFESAILKAQAIS